MATPTVTDVVTNLDDLKGLFGLNPVLIGDVVVDVLTTYTDALEAEISEHPVEAGFDIANARNIKPQTLTMECILADPDISGSNIAMSALSGTLGNLTTSWRDKRDRLIEIFNSNEVITVSTPERAYDNMTITSVIPDKRAATGNGHFFSIELREIKIVNSDFAIIDPDLIPKAIEEKASASQKTVATKVKPKKSQVGNKATNTASTKNQSILDAMIFG